MIYEGILGFCTCHVFSFLHLSSCLVYKCLNVLFLAPLMSLDILLFSCEVLSLRYRNVGAQEVIVQYLFVYTSLSVFNLSGLSILCVTKQFTKCKFLLIAVLICWVFLKLNKYSTQQERLFSMWPCCCNLRRDRIFFS